MSIQHMSAIFDLVEPRGSSRWVLLVIAEHANIQSGECWPSEARIAQRAGLHPATVKRAIGELEQAGLIAVQRAPGRTNRYLLCVDPAPSAKAIDRAHDAPSKGQSLGAPRPYTGRTPPRHPAHLSPRTLNNLKEPDCHSVSEEPEPMTASNALAALRAVLGRKEEPA